MKGSYLKIFIILFAIIAVIIAIRFGAGSLFEGFNNIGTTESPEESTVETIEETTDGESTQDKIQPSETVFGGIYSGVELVDQKLTESEVPDIINFEFARNYNLVHRVTDLEKNEYTVVFQNDVGNLIYFIFSHPVKKYTSNGTTADLTFNEIQSEIRDFDEKLKYLDIEKINGKDHITFADTDFQSCLGKTEHDGIYYPMNSSNIILMLIGSAEISSLDENGVSEIKYPIDRSDINSMIDICLASPSPNELPFSFELTRADPPRGGRDMLTFLMIEAEP